MKHMVFERADGISIGGANIKIIAAMTGLGGLIPRASEPISPKHLEYIERYAVANPAVQAILDHRLTRPLIELDYEIAKSVAIDGIPEVIARECFEGKAFGGLTEDEAHRRLMARHAENVRITVGPVIASHLCEHTDLPGEYDKSLFRAAWHWQSNRVTVDLAKARGIHMDDTRVVRNIELQKLDVPYMKALEADDTVEQQRIAGLKQTLRDIPQTFDLTTDTPEQLKAKWPTELPARE